MYRDIKKNPVSSCIYKKIVIPDNIIDFFIKKHYISVTGILGTLTCKLHKSIIIQQEDNVRNIIICANVCSINKALIGTTVSLINNMIIGVTKGFSKKLQLIGIGYRVSIINDIINLVIGLSHPIRYKLPIAVKSNCISQTEIVLTSINKQLVGQVAADLRSFKPPEPFKGKGIRYMDEIVHNKDSKKK